MASSRPAAKLLLMINLFLYMIVLIIASWAVNHAINRSHESASVLSLPAHIFPVYFPMGNMATGFFVIISLLAGVVGVTTSLTGVYDITSKRYSTHYPASFSSLIAWAITMLAMGFASKEIDKGFTNSNLRSMEVLIIILSGTQLLCMSAILVGTHSGRDPGRIAL
ncbi:hypothetical protein V2J09_005605 [Rumex salicifolius]